LNNLTVIKLEHKNQRVLTTAQLAEFYETDIVRIAQNYTRNIEKYQEGVHNYKIGGEELKAMKADYQIDIPPNVNSLMLWTEKGALLHAKSLNTDKAWEVYGKLVDTYFKKQLPIQLDSKFLFQIATQLEEKEKQVLVLTTENKLLSQQNLQWATRNTLNAIIKAYGIIYIIINKCNNKVYIGQTVQGFSRRYCHTGSPIEKVYKSQLSRKNLNKNYNTHLARSIEKYGFDNFVVDSAFDVAFSKEELDRKESLYIKLFNSDDSRFGYNNNGGGANGIPNEETRRKMSEALKGHPNHLKFQTEETRKKISESTKGKILSEITKIKISNARTGMTFSAEHKTNLSKVRNNPEHNASKKVICLNTGEIFPSQAVASRKYKSGKVGDCCRGVRRSAGNINGERLSWLFLSDYEEKTGDEIVNLIGYANELVR
jgi:group I intron endonuclease